MSINPAGLFLRLSAFIIDFFIITTICGILIYFINEVHPIKATSELTWKVFYISYLTITPIFWGGYVIGKRICNIKINRYKDNKNVTIYNMFFREVVGNYILVLATFGMSAVASIFMVIFREDKRGIHDFIGGTYVRKSNF